ncbi:peptidoglycan-binding domain-containing protein [Luteimonas aquatica]|uniref:peptidoglycan-binding domain-containing protein n=1 Tax=Luteimonas aquatica TaxID=450364 RepID=UPI001F576A07|nr:peptidoglycan-binding domain-containing protein [Luteimonas aquatica]
MADREWHLGITSEKYESSKAGPGAVSSGVGDHGGVSYGTHQLSTNEGSVQEFVKQSAYADDFAGMKPATPEFNAKWKELAANDPGFGKAQDQFFKDKYYGVMVDNLKEKGIDLSDRGPAVQDAMWSTAIQFGPNNAKKRIDGPELFQKALNEKFGDEYKLSDLSDKQIIEAVQDYKIAHNESLFRSSSDEWRKNLLDRAKNEKDDLLYLAENGKVREEAARGKGGGSSWRPENGDGVLRLKEEGPAVKEMQEKLVKLGLLEAAGADGKYGKDTETAVRKFQEDNNLKGVDGKAGPETLKSIDQKLQQQQGTQQETRQGAQQETQQGTDQLRRDNPMFDQAVKELEKQGPNGGFKSREDMERAASQVAFEAKVSGMSRIDELVPSKDEKGLIAVERNPNNPLDVNRAYVDREQAAQVPLEQSQQQFNAEAQRQTQEAQARQQSQPTQSGPTQ